MSFFLSICPVAKWRLGDIRDVDVLVVFICYILRKKSLNKLCCVLERKGDDTSGGTIFNLKLGWALIGIEPPLCLDMHTPSCSW